jgi:hypothetical protein
MVSAFVENNEEALELARENLIPRLLALLLEPLRIAWAMQTPISASNTQAVVRSALARVEEYSQR